MVGTIIFDWSGVVSDDTRTVVWALNQAFSKYGISKVTLRDFCDNYGNIEEVMGERYGVEIDLDSFWEDYNCFIRSCPHRPVMIEGVDKVIPVVNHDRRLVVFSSHPSDCLEDEARRYGIRQHFHLLEGGVMYKTERIEAFLGELGVDVSDVLYVGDTTVDVDAAKKVNVRFVGVLTGYHGNRFYGSSKFLEAGVSRENILDDLSELPEFLKRIS